MSYNTIERETHFTAIISVEKTVITTNTEVSSKPFSKREPKEIAKITIRAKTLEALREKAAKHIDLVEEI